jgi:tight adherence protein C
MLRRRMIQAASVTRMRLAISSLAAPRWLSGLRCCCSCSPRQPGGSAFWLLVGLGGIAGYLGPSLYIDKRIKTRKAEHQSGFPNFMDLLVVCADASLSTEASLDHVGRELSDSCPFANLQMTNLEIRTGCTMSDALEHLGDRLGIEEARSFATFDPAVGRARLKHHRGAAGLFR